MVKASGNICVFGSSRAPQPFPFLLVHIVAHFLRQTLLIEGLTNDGLLISKSSQGRLTRIAN